MTYRQECGLMAQIWFAAYMASGSITCGVMGCLFFSCRWFPETIRIWPWPTRDASAKP